MIPETTKPYDLQIQTKDNQVEGTSGHQVGGPRYVRAVDRVGSSADNEDWADLVPTAEEYQDRQVQVQAGQDKATRHHQTGSPYQVRVNNLV